MGRLCTSNRTSRTPCETRNRPARAAECEHRHHGTGGFEKNPLRFHPLRPPKVKNVVTTYFNFGGVALPYSLGKGLFLLPLCKKFRNMSMHGPRSAPRRRIELAIERACSQVRGQQLDQNRPSAPHARASRYGIRCAREASKTPLFTFVSLARAIPHGSRRGWRRWKALGALDDLR